MIKIYTDGSAHHGHQLRYGGWAAIIVPDEGEAQILQGQEKHTTSQRMELMAAIMALASFSSKESIELFTDSQYLQRGITEWLPNWEENGWKTSTGKPVKNSDLWIKLKYLCLAHFVEFTWIKGHAGHPENEYVDRLAKEAARIK